MPKNPRLRDQGRGSDDADKRPAGGAMRYKRCHPTWSAAFAYYRLAILKALLQTKGCRQAQSPAPERFHLQRGSRRKRDHGQWGRGSCIESINVANLAKLCEGVACTACGSMRTVYVWFPRQEECFLGCETRAQMVFHACHLPSTTRPSWPEVVGVCPLRTVREREVWHHVVEQSCRSSTVCWCLLRAPFAGKAWNQIQPL